MRGFPALAALTVACGATETNSAWTPAATLPEPLQEIHAAVLRGRIYVAGGIDRENAASRAAYRYDPGADAWERIADLPAGRHHMPLAVANDTLYALGGLGPQGFEPVATVWLYDETNNRWTDRAPLPEPRGASAAAELDGHVVVVGGFGTGGTLLDSIALYDPRTNRWRRGAPIPTRRDHLAAATVGGALFAVGGRPLDADRNFAVTERYQLQSNAWVTRARMPTARGGLGAASLAGKIHVVGGETSSSVFSEHESYDPATDTWATLSPLPTARHGLAVAAVGEAIYVIGGGPRAGFAQTDVVEVYRPR